MDFCGRHFPQGFETHWMTWCFNSNNVISISPWRERCTKFQVSKRSMLVQIKSFSSLVCTFYFLCLWEMGKGGKSTIKLFQVSLLRKTDPCCFYRHWASGRWSKVISLVCFHVNLCLFVIVLHLSKVGMFCFFVCSLHVWQLLNCFKWARNNASLKFWASSLDLLNDFGHVTSFLWMSVFFCAKQVRAFRLDHPYKAYCNSNRLFFGTFDCSGGNRSGWSDGTRPAIVGVSSFGWSGVAKAEFRSFIIFCLSKVIGKIASSLLGRRNEREWEGRAEKVGALMGMWFLTTPQHTLSSSRNLTTSPLRFLSNLCLSPFFCQFYLFLSLNLSLWDEQENARNETQSCQMIV